jgi:hypothetical protein
MYNPETHSFEDAPNAAQKLLKDPKVQAAIQKASKFLGR